jgi:hypothetical protein
MSGTDLAVILAHLDEIQAEVRALHAAVDARFGVHEARVDALTEVMNQRARAVAVRSMNKTLRDVWKLRWKWRRA